MFQIITFCFFLKVCFVFCQIYPKSWCEQKKLVSVSGKGYEVVVKESSREEGRPVVVMSTSVIAYTHTTKQKTRTGQQQKQNKNKEGRQTNKISLCLCAAHFTELPKLTGLFCFVLFFKQAGGLFEKRKTKLLCVALLWSVC